MPRKVLVTGGAGFIGSHLVEELVTDGYEVVVLDNLVSGRLENLNNVIDRITFHEVDISNCDYLNDLFDGVDWVFHIAAVADIVPSICNPIHYHRCNVDGTIAVLEAARHANVQRFVYAASSSCYGIPDIVPTPEDAEIRPMYPYAFTKYVGEQYVFHWHKVYNLPVVSLRFFNVYGPRARTTGTYGAVFGVFLAQKLAGKPFTVVGDGEQTRDFTFVTDIVKALCYAADSGVVGEMFNVGSGGTYSVNKLVSLLGGDVINIPKRPGEPDVTFADISKIQRVLHWQPEVSFEDGVAKMLEVIDQWKTAPVWDKHSIEDATKEWFACLS